MINNFFRREPESRTFSDTDEFDDVTDFERLGMDLWCADILKQEMAKGKELFIEDGVVQGGKMTLVLGSAIWIRKGHWKEEGDD